MRDADCVAFLQWALPRLNLRWKGFRKVHGQVCKRLKRRMKALGLADIAAYRARLEINPGEWAVFDRMCHITISRFFRDSRTFEALAMRVLPEIGEPKQPSVELESLAVRSDCQTSGMGKALVEEAIRRIRPLHPAQIIALTFHPEFFKKLGFKEIEKKSLIHKIYMGCVSCTKYDSPFTCPEVAVAYSLLPTA